MLYGIIYITNLLIKGHGSMNKILTYSTIGLGVCMFSSSTMVSAEPIDSQQINILHSRAVQLARNGEYTQSIDILKNLEKQGIQDDSIWSDYITILSWAGKNQEMITVAETHFGNNILALPDYAALPLAKAYLKVGQEEKGKKLLLYLEKNGNAEAKLLSAEIYLQEGNHAAGQALYDELIMSRKIPLDSVYLSQAKEAMKRNDFIAAEKYFSLAKQTAVKNTNNSNRDIDAVRAAMYIQRREEDRAVNILRPYVVSGKASMRMISDYLTALRFDNKQKEAISDFKKYCPDWSKVPVYGLENMGDLYLRGRKYHDAIKIYSYILTRADIGYVHLGLAYCLAMTGHDDNAFDEYKIVRKTYPELQPAIATDGTNFLSIGKLHLARKLYGLLGTTLNEKINYQLQFAQALSDIDTDTGDDKVNFSQAEALNGRSYYHESQSIFKRLAENNESVNVAATAGIAKNKITKGLYGDADKILEKLNAKNAMDAALYSANMPNDNRITSELNFYYTNGVDYQKNHTEETGVEYQYYLAGNFYGSLATSHHYLTDDVNKISYQKNEAGISYRFDRGNLGLVYNLYSNDVDMNNITTNFAYEFNDLSSIEFSTGRQPHDTASGVESNITERFHTIRWNQIVDDKWRFGLEYNWNNLSDNNYYKNYALSTTYALSNNTVYRDNLLFNFNRGSYNWTSDSYDSPLRRIDFYGGFSRKWYIPSKHRTWEWIAMLGWGHDNGYGYGFEPMTRIELGQELKKNQNLVVGVEYNWHKASSSDAGLNYRDSGYLVDINYYWGW